MKNGVKRWLVTYDHKDGRSGTVEVETEIKDSGAFKYGNCKAGRITAGKGDDRLYDLRYEHGDLHKLMVEDYFGSGLIEAIEQ